jgi:pilus assembly protein CpaC
LSKKKNIGASMMGITQKFLRQAAVSLALVAGFAPLSLTMGYAQSRQINLASGQAAVKVVQRTSQTLKTEQAFTDIVVADPEIADAVPLTDRSIYILGKNVGVTSVSIYNAEKALVGVLQVEITKDAPRAARDIKRSGNEGVRVGTQAGKIILEGEARDAVAADRAAQIARSHGGDVINHMRVKGPQQVMLEVRFLEVSRTAGRDLGVRIGARGSDGRAASGAGQVGTLGFLAGASALATGAGAPFGTVISNLVRNGTNIDVLIQALEEQGVARRLAEPNLVTMSGEKASFLAGGEMPIPVAQQQGQISIEFKKFGVGLTFTPTVLGGSLINLRIEPEVSQVDQSTGGINVGGITVPRLIVSRASTVVELKSGQSFAIAGLLQNTTTTTTEQLPWIADVPVLGTLFRSKGFQQKETELAIIVTPHLVQPFRPGQKIRTPLDNTRPGNDLEQFVMGRSEVARDGSRRQPPIDPRAAAARASGSGHILDLGGTNATQ